MTQPAADHPRTERVALSRELAGFLVELAIALQSHGTYPPGHPFLARSAEAVMRRLDALLLDRDTLSLGVARRQLVIEGVATDPHNPVLSGLAGRLHRHRVGAVSLRRGVEADEVAGLLTWLAAEPSPAAGGPPAPPPAGAWPHVSLHAVSYAQLELTGDGADGAGRAEAVRAAQLWIGLARAALAAGEGAEIGTPEAAVVARAIDEHPQAPAYDQVIVGHLLQLAEELRHEGGPGAAEVRRRMSEMIRTLSPATLARLVEMGGDEAQRRRFVLDASHGFAAEAVVKLVEAAAAARAQPVSGSLLRLLGKLAAHAEAAPGPAGAAADAALREQVQWLVSGWQLQDPNPEAYGAALDRFARFSVGRADAAGGRHEPEPERIVQTALEVGAGGAAAWTALVRMASEAGPAALVRLLAGAPGPSAFADEAWEYAASAENVRALLRAGPEAADALDAVLARLGEAAIPPLLDELAESEVRVVRRAAITRLAKLGPAAAVEAARRLGDARWFVVRNLLGLLHELGIQPDGFSPAPFTRHADARVRREAFKLAFRMADERTRALGLALTDADAQVVRMALAECLGDCPAPAVPLVCRRAEDAEADAELRLLAIRVLGAARDPLAVQALLRLAHGGRTLLGKVRLAPRSPEMLGALASLSGGWARHPEAAPLLAVAMKSTDPEVLRAVLLKRDGAG